MSGILPVLTTFTKGIQVACDTLELGEGVVDYVQANSQSEKEAALAKTIAGTARVVFSSIEVGGRACGMSNKGLANLKNGESLTGILIGSMEMHGAICDYQNGKISIPRAIEKSVAPILSLIRTCNESSLYQNRYYLSLSPEELAKERRIVPVKNFDPEYPEYELKPVIKEECETALALAEQSELPLLGIECILRTGMTSSAINKIAYLYCSLANAIHGHHVAAAPILQAWVPPPAPPAPPAFQPQDPYDFMGLSYIPDELHEDSIFKKYSCPLSLLPIRDPVGDPTICSADGSIIKSIFEREVMVKWIRQNGTSPTTRQPLTVRQLVEKPHIKAVIDHCLRMHAVRMRAYASNLPPLTPDPVLIHYALAEAPVEDNEEKKNG